MKKKRLFIDELKFIYVSSSHPNFPTFVAILFVRTKIENDLVIDEVAVVFFSRAQWYSGLPHCIENGF